MQKTLPALLLIVTVCVSGCFTRSVYPRPGSPVRLRESIRKVKVWLPREVIRNGKKVTEYTIPSVLELGEGGFFLPDWEGRKESDTQ